jgi:hypothetical protein
MLRATTRASENEHRGGSKRDKHKRDSGARFATSRKVLCGFCNARGFFRHGHSAEHFF